MAETESSALGAKAIRSTRTDLGLTQRELAQLLDTSVTTVARWELGLNSPRGRNREAMRLITSCRKLPASQRTRLLDYVALGVQCGIRPSRVLRPEVLRSLRAGQANALELLAAVLRPSADSPSGKAPVAERKSGALH